jgi:hypothetical protein
VERRRGIREGARKGSEGKEVREASDGVKIMRLGLIRFHQRFTSGLVEAQRDFPVKSQCAAQTQFVHHQT